MTEENLNKATELKEKLESCENLLYKIESLLSGPNYWASFQNNEKGRKYISISFLSNKIIDDFLENKAADLRKGIAETKTKLAEL